LHLDGAKVTWMLDHQKTTNDIPTDSDIFGTNRYIAKKLRCPSGGVYTLGSLNDRPKCSIPGHTLW
jgi:hypothetical protein